MQEEIDKIFEQRLKEIEAKNKWAKDEMLDYEEKFVKKYGAFKLYLVKLKLKRYITLQEKYEKLLRKYEILHKSLSLAVTSGFSSIKNHQEYLKNITEKVSKLKEDKNGNN